MERCIVRKKLKLIEIAIIAVIIIIIISVLLLNENMEAAWEGVLYLIFIPFMYLILSIIYMMLNYKYKKEQVNNKGENIKNSNLYKIVIINIFLTPIYVYISTIIGKYINGEDFGWLVYPLIIYGYATILIILLLIFVIINVRYKRYILLYKEIKQDNDKIKLKKRYDITLAILHISILLVIIYVIYNVLRFV